MTIATKINASLQGASWIREMFEKGRRLKEQFGADNVFDFSLGNPNLPPPEQFSTILRDSAENYCPMPADGYSQAYDAVAAYLSEEQQVPVSAKSVLMNFGAAGALNVVLKTLLDPGDEVILIKPVFVDYRAYVDNHQGISNVVDCRADFQLDLNAIGKAVNTRTKAIIINSPNNPSGQIYPEENLKDLGQLLKARSRELGSIIYLLSDEPYRKIVYDGHRVPGIFKAYEQSIIATSYSKDLSIPGERIGFAAVNPAADYLDEIMEGMKVAIRILGFINAPALMQRVISNLQGIRVNIDAYDKKRNLLCRGLADAGYDFLKPSGTFYLFPKTPIEDDVAFVQELQKELILTVPGKGFLYPGHFRISFCVDDDTIINSLPGFRRVMNRYK